MAKVLVIYNAPADAEAFDDYYANTHTPIAQKIPGLRSPEISRGDIANPTGAIRSSRSPRLTATSIPAARREMSS